MPSRTQEHNPALEPLPRYRSILLAVDSSDHSDRGVIEAVELSRHYGSTLTATHVYAAKLHDARFRQMEGGLPEQFREETELERQRDVHDDLITRGLSIITDSYLDQVESVAREQAIQVKRRSLEGKNYRALVDEASSGEYDLLVMGALGLGAIQGSRLGTVCQRVARRCKIDTLIIKQPARPLSEGPIVVAVDGSEKAYGGLLTALSLAAVWQVEVKVVSAFDPYYHYVAFNRIAGILSDEAGKVFKFKEQEKLHEEIIDSGLARIYQGHLSVSQSIARGYGVEIEPVLLDGKPHDVITRYLRETEPSLLVMGTTGIHADPGLDIGGNTEHLLCDVECSVLLSQRKHRPETDRLASVTTAWSREAETRMERVPDFVRPMARMAILRYAQEEGHTVITAAIVEEATARLMPGHAAQAMEEIVEAYDRGELKRKPATDEAIRWSEEATRLLLTVTDLSLRGNLSMRAEKRARADGKRIVEAEHIATFLDLENQVLGTRDEVLGTKEEVLGTRDEVLGKEKITRDRGPKAEDRGKEDKNQEKERTAPAADPLASKMYWQAAALARLMRVPEGFMRESARQRIETHARAGGHPEVTLAVAEAGLAVARKAMEQGLGPRTEDRGTKTKDPGPGTKNRGEEGAVPETSDGASAMQNRINWDSNAEALMGNVPAGFCREMTRKAAEGIAGQRGIREIDAGFVQQVMETFKSGSGQGVESMPWEPGARERIAKAPDMVRGMLIQEIEGWARRNELPRVTGEAVDAVKQIWAERGLFHLDPNDPRNG
jgi:nucleotide-binding universal stress UspA family protein